jgi:outer membrane protein OmpA-like peptidoglycan-associated protein
MIKKTFSFYQLAGLALTVTIMLVKPCLAGFQEGMGGVRPAGMGQAFVSIADDANTVLFNPAGFTRIAVPELTGMYSDLYSNLSPGLYNGRTDRLGYNFVSLAMPVSESIGAFGAAWSQFTSTVYQENTFTLSYARVLEPVTRLAAGLNLKLLQWGVESNQFTDDPGLFPAVDRSKLGFTLDAGILVALLPDLQIGLGLNNILLMNMALVGEEIVPLMVRLGAAYQLPLKLESLDALRTTLELNYRQEEINYMLGAEAWFFNRHFALRSGFNLDEFTAGLSFSPIWTESALGLCLDYAFSYPFAITGTYGSHRLGVTIQWDKHTPKPEKKPEKVVIIQKVQIPAEQSDEYQRMKAEVANLQQQVSALEGELSEFTKQIQVGKLSPILFKTGKSVLRSKVFPTLDYLGKILRKYPVLLVRIEGHTDSRGDEISNLRLSQKRMEAVQKYLVKNQKIDPDHLLPVGYGESKPIASNKTAVGRRKNRRVEFKVINPFQQREKPETGSGRKKSRYQYHK